MERIPVLNVENLSVSFSQYMGVLRKTQIQAIKDLNVALYQGEIVAVVGASGSGKSLLAHAILGILPYNASMGGGISYCGEPLTQEYAKKLRGREIVLVPQNVSYLDPLMKVGPQIRKNAKDKLSKEKTLNILKGYGLAAETERLYPFELSGGMARRVLISTAVLESPRLVIADEPTPGLDAAAAKRVMGHFREIADNNAAVLLITHDLELAIETADRIAVFYEGTTLEEVQASDFAEGANLCHPYTRALWQAMPRNGMHAEGEKL